MIAQECAPSLRRRKVPPPHVFGDGRLCDNNGRLEQFSVDPWGTPERILSADAADESPHVGRNQWPTGPPSRLPAPEAPKAGPMPSDQGLRLDDHNGSEN